MIAILSLEKHRSIYYKWLQRFFIFRSLVPIYYFCRAAGRETKLAIEPIYARMTLGFFFPAKFPLGHFTKFQGSSLLRSESIFLEKTHPPARPQFHTPEDFAPIFEKDWAPPNLEAKLYRIKNAIVTGSTSLIEVDGQLLTPESYDAQRDMIWMELRSFAKVRPSKQTVSLYSSRAKPRVVETAINLIGQCSGNYAHFISEILPKLILADKHGLPAEIPVLVDGWIDDVFFKILSTFNVNNRPVIRVGLWQRFKVRELVHIAEIGYAPAESRHLHEKKELPYPNSKQFAFSAGSYAALRSQALKLSSPSNEFKPFIFLKRNSGSYNQRLLTNEAELEACAVKYGFDVIDPMTLSFKEQIQLFKNAKVVISSIGAALANTVFSPQGCKVITLSPYYHNANYYYFANLLGAFGHNLIYVLGKQASVLRSKHSILHQDYSVDIDLFERALTQTLDSITDIDSK